MSNYGLVTDYKKYGTGSLYVPFDRSGVAKFLIDPVVSNSLNISANQDFYISFWAQFKQNVTYSTLPGIYPILRLGDYANGGIEFGYYVTSTHSSVYVSWANNQFFELYTSGMSAANLPRIKPSGTVSGLPRNFDHWIFKRVGNTITFSLDNGFGPNGYQFGDYQFGYPMSQSISGYGSKTFTINQVQIVSTTRGTNASTSTGCDIWYDEIYFAKGISAPVNIHPTTGQINDGGLETTAFLYNFNDNYRDDQGLIKEFNADLTVNSSITADSANSKEFSASLTTTSSQSTSARKSVVNSAALTVEGSTLVATGRIRPEVAALDVSTSLSATISRVKNASASLSTTVSQSVNEKYVTLFDANISASSTLTATPRYSAVDSASLSTTTTVTASANKIANFAWDEKIKSLFHFNGGYTDEISNTGVTHTGSGTFVTSATGFGQQFRAPANSYVTVNRTEANIPPNSSPYEYSIDFKLTQLTAPGSTAVVTIFQMRSTYSPGLYFYHELRLDYRSNELKVVRWRSDQGSSSANTIKSAGISLSTTPTNISLRTTTGSATPTELFIDGTSQGSFDWLSGVNAPGPFKIGNVETISGTNGAFGFDEFRLIIGTYIDSPTSAPYGPYYQGAGALESQFSISTVGYRVKRTTADLNSSSSAVINGGKIRYGTAALTASSTMSTTGVRLLKSTASVTVTATQSTAPVKRAVGSSADSVTATLSAANSRTRNAVSALSTTATLVANATKKASAVNSLSSQATLTANNARTRATNATFDVIASELTAAAKTGQGLVHSQVTATMAIIARKTAVGRSTVTANATLQGQAKSVQFGVASLSSTVTVSATPTYLRRNEVVAQATATLSAQGQVNRTFNAGLTTSSSLSATIKRTRTTDSTQQAQTTLTVNNQIIRLASANLQSEFTVLASPFKVFRAHADLVVEGFMMSVGRVLEIDPSLTIKVKSESRYLKVHSEVRELIIDSETRIYKIKDKS